MLARSHVIEILFWVCIILAIIAVAYIREQEWTKKRVEINYNVAKRHLDLLQNDKDERYNRDPFTTKPFLTVERNNVKIYYSMGPDRIDHKAKVLYDPTNGIFSAGDIFLPINENKQP